MNVADNLHIAFVVIDNDTIERPLSFSYWVGIDHIKAIATYTIDYMADKFAVMCENVAIVDFTAVFVFQPGVHAKRSLLDCDAAVLLVCIFKYGRSAAIPNQITMYPAATAYGFAAKINRSHCLHLSFEVL